MAGIGIMEGAYFVGRGELLTWINSFLNLNYTKVEQTATGVAHCLLLNSVYPGQIPASKLIMDAKHEWEFIRNLKQLQEAFIRLGIDKVVDIGRLSKAKYQDNLEFTQWMKCWWDRNYKGDWTPPPAITVKLECGRAEVNATRPPKLAAKAAAARKPAAAVAPVVTRAAPRVTNVGSPARRTAPAKKENGPTGFPTTSAATLQLVAENMEKERDMYYSKLVEIEKVFQAQPDDAPAAVKQLKNQVFAILLGSDANVPVVIEETAAPPAAVPAEFVLSPLHV